MNEKIRQNKTAQLTGQITTHNISEQVQLECESVVTVNK